MFAAFATLICHTLTGYDGALVAEVELVIVALVSVEAAILFSK